MTSSVQQEKNKSQFDYFISDGTLGKVKNNCVNKFASIWSTKSKSIPVAEAQDFFLYYFQFG